MDRTVAVTGGSGKLGRTVVAALIEEGWTVVNFDRVPSPDSRARFIRTDLTDYGQVVEALSGIDEVHSGVNARRTFGRHSRCDLRAQRRDLRQQPGVDLPRLPGRQAVQDSQSV
jgi:NAD(P)-dependent dehydrogenase (short-subunit alcohol dehydrogenase family)